jgi:ABC-type antimicrobial peptide transport system permease subunit
VEVAGNFPNECRYVLEMLGQVYGHDAIRERLVSSLSVAFGLLALALTCIGLYGILAYSVARRTNEIGIRLALGASRAETVWMVLREALVLAAAGVVIGMPFVWLLGAPRKRCFMA